jgi:hypothetical protein
MGRPGKIAPHRITQLKDAVPLLVAEFWAYQPTTPLLLRHEDCAGEKLFEY